MGKRFRILLAALVGLLAAAAIVVFVVLDDPPAQKPPPPHSHREPTGEPRVLRVSPRTFAKSASSARPGDTVVLGPGTYGRRGTSLRIRRDGTPSNPIVFRGAKGQPRPKVLGHVRVDASHVRLERLEFAGPTGQVVERTAANPRGEEVQVWIRGHDVTISGSEVRDNAWHAGVFVTASDARIVRNFIHDNGDSRDPRQRNLDHGIYWASGAGGLIADNLIEGNLAYGVHLYPRPAGVRVLQNTLVRNGRAGLILADDTADALVANNIIAFNGDDEITSGLAGDGNVLANNLFWQNGSGAVSASDGLADAPKVVADPLFAGPRDYRLSPASPAIRGGARRHATRTDFEGNPRPAAQRPDLGAFQAGPRPAGE